MKLIKHEHEDFYTWVNILICSKKNYLREIICYAQNDISIYYSKNDLWFKSYFQVYSKSFNECLLITHAHSIDVILLNMLVCNCTNEHF